MKIVQLNTSELNTCILLPHFSYFSQNFDELRRLIVITDIFALPYYLYLLVFTAYRIFDLRKCKNVKVFISPVFHCHLFYHKFHIVWSEIEPGHLRYVQIFSYEICKILFLGSVKQVLSLRKAKSLMVCKKIMAFLWQS
jgi:hypothetical protein